MKTAPKNSPRKKANPFVAATVAATMFLASSAFASADGQASKGDAQDENNVSLSVSYSPYGSVKPIMAQASNMKNMDVCKKAGENIVKELGHGRAICVDGNTGRVDIYKGGSAGKNGWETLSP